MMNKDFYKKFVFSILGLVCCGTPNLLADEIGVNPKIYAGMSYGDVLEMCGKPKEKIDYEVKHEELWIYKYYEVRFKEGKTIVKKVNNERKLKKTRQRNRRLKHQAELAEQEETKDWGAIEPINDNVSFADIIKGAEAMPPKGKK